MSKIHPIKDAIILTTGLGLSDQGVPLRLPALLLPGLSLLRKLTESDQSAQYVVYQATDFIIETNELNAPRANQCAERMQQYLRDFVDHFFPDLAPNVCIKTKDDCPVDDNILNKIEATFDELISVLDGSEETDSASVLSAFNLIRDYGSHHKGSSAFMRYAAANVLLNGGYKDTYPLLNLSAYAPVTVMPLGGKREEPFFTLTTAVAAHTGCAHCITPMIVPTGKMPAYYPCPDGDLLLGAPDSAFLPPRRIKGDFAALNEIGASTDILQRLGGCRPITRRRALAMEARL